MPCKSAFVAKVVPIFILLINLTGIFSDLIFKRLIKNYLIPSIGPSLECDYEICLNKYELTILDCKYYCT